MATLNKKIFLLFHSRNFVFCKLLFYLFFYITILLSRDGTKIINIHDTITHYGCSCVIASTIHIRFYYAIFQFLVSGRKINAGKENS